MRPDFHHQEVAVVSVPPPTAPLAAFQEVDGLERHGGEAGFATGIACAVPFPLHVAAFEESEHRQALPRQPVELRGVVDVRVARSLILGAKVSAIGPAAARGLLVQQRVRHEMPPSAAEEHIDAIAERRRCRSHRVGSDCNAMAFSLSRLLMWA